jgi:RIO kinase 1
MAKTEEENEREESDYGSDAELDDLESALLGDSNYSNQVHSHVSNGAEFGKNTNFSARVQNDINRSIKKSEKRPNYYGRDDRATSEQVLDPRTRLILFKLLNTGFLAEIDGCLSTGKEANVYHSTTNNSTNDLAVKIYKTSILTFKDRDKYVTGEFRFRHGYCRSNPRKMVRTWAEKEFRNLSRYFFYFK